MKDLGIDWNRGSVRFQMRFDEGVYTLVGINTSAANISYILAIPGEEQDEAVVRQAAHEMVGTSKHKRETEIVSLLKEAGAVAFRDGRFPSADRETATAREAFTRGQHVEPIQRMRELFAA